jgi:hypothetical protein
MSSTLQVRFGGYSIAGQKPVNQDAFAAWCGQAESNLLKGAAAAIADGVSSCADSHVAQPNCGNQFSG